MFYTTWAKELSREVYVRIGDITAEGWWDNTLGCNVSGHTLWWNHGSVDLEVIEREREERSRRQQAVNLLTQALNYINDGELDELMAVALENRARVQSMLDVEEQEID